MCPDLQVTIKNFFQLCYNPEKGKQKLYVTSLEINLRESTHLNLTGNSFHLKYFRSFETFL